ncbi:MAG TPA: ABC transporter ATP-binding protein [Thermomicrobiaceae bacterium]|nr:ABC transporter ATP-binding protein [Thermomicrobiaceae bacterium]
MIESPQPVIEVRGVSQAFGAVRALEDVSLAIPPGVIYGLIGPSGSGKTTLIRLLVGVLRPERGEVCVFGRKMPDRAVAGRIGYMTQSTALYPDLSLRENLSFFGALYGLGDARLRRRIEEVSREVALADRLDSPLHTFSGGMQRRASLACALIHQPELLILDEPTVGLDPVLRRAFWERFHRLAQAGRTLIVTSHIMDEAGRCDLLGFIRDGRLLASGTPDELRRLTGQAELEEAFLALAEREKLPVEGAR